MRKKVRQNAFSIFVWSEQESRLPDRRCFLSLRENEQQGQRATQTADRAPRKVTTIYKGVKSDKNACIFRLVGRAETARKRAAF